MFAAVGKVQTGAHDERRDRARDEHFTRFRQGRDACADVDGDPGHVLATAFDLAGVYARPNRKPCGLCGFDHVRCAVHSAGGTVERRQHPVPGGAHLDATVAGEHVAQHLVVTAEQ